MALECVHLVTFKIKFTNPTLPLYKGSAVKRIMQYHTGFSGSTSISEGLRITARAVFPIHNTIAVPRGLK